MIPLTAQEAFEQEGYLIFASPFDRKPGDVVENSNAESCLPVGTKAVVIGKLSRDEAQVWCQRVGDSLPDYPSDAKFYMVVAE